MSEHTVGHLSEALEGRYHVERVLGEGGMATVYLARDERHNRRVALKVLKPELAAVVGSRRFLSEIETTASLQHPHILPLFDSGEADGALYYVMPYVVGESLRERLERERQLPVEEAVRIAADVAEALDHAHRHGVVHRDVKPANILLQDGNPVVSDFGIALAVGEARASRLTETGLSLGTPYYMSPEQATGDASVGPAADVYALACVLYEMLVGVPPFTGSTPQAVLGKIISGEAPSASRERPSVPANVDAAIRRALEKLPADRFARASDFAAALAQPGFRHGSEAAPGAAGHAATAPWRAVALGLAAVAALLAGVAGWALSRPDPPAAVVRTAIPLPPDMALETTPGSAFALSPDGTEIVLAGTSGGTTQLWLRSLDALAVTPLPGTEGARTPAYRPDGTAVAFVSGGRLLTAPLSGAPPHVLLEAGVAAGSSGLAWSDDGWIHFRGANGGLRRVRDDGTGGEEILTSGDEDLDLHPDALPGGRGLLFTRNLAGGDSEVFVLDLESREEHRLFEGRTARFDRSGHVVYTSGDGVLTAVPFDGPSLRVTGSPRALFAGVRTDLRAGSQFAVSAAGALLYLEGTANVGFLLAEVDLEGGRRFLPLTARDYDSGPAWSPDGVSVAFSSDQQIFTYDTGGVATPRQITFEGVNVRPAFSPDGRRLAFSSARDSAGYDLFVKDLGDDASPRRLAVLEGDQFATHWPADTLLLFRSTDASGVSDLWMLDLSDPARPEARPYLTAGADLRAVVLSPDGRLAAYMSDESGTEEIYVRGFPDPAEPTVVSRGGGTIPFWTPDGRTLVYATRVGRVHVAARLEREPVPRVLSIDTLFGDPGMAAIPLPQSSLHPDGDRFVFAVYPDAIAADGAGSQLGRLVLVQGFRGELRRLGPSD